MPKATMFISCARIQLHVSLYQDCHFTDTSHMKCIHQLVLPQRGQPPTPPRAPPCSRHLLGVATPYAPPPPRFGSAFKSPRTTLPHCMSMRYEVWQRGKNIVSVHRGVHPTVARVHCFRSPISCRRCHGLCKQQGSILVPVHVW